MKRKELVSTNYKSLIVIGALFLVSNTVKPFQQISLFVQLEKQSCDMTYRKCHDQIFFKYKPFKYGIYPQWQPTTGLFAETFTLQIPQGKVCSDVGFIVQGDNILKEFLPQTYPVQVEDRLQTMYEKAKVPKKVKGRVAVITKIYTEAYGHFLLEVVAKLALLKISGLEYDWLYVCYDKPYMKEILTLAGVDVSKIIDASQPENYYIQADELIATSPLNRRIPMEGEKNFSPRQDFAVYCPAWAINYLRELFWPMIDKKLQFSERVFISRKHAGLRKMVNENEVFDVFAKKGFKRYELEKMSFLQQVALFKQAEYVVGATGSGLSNILFCQPGTQVIEIMQELRDITFCTLAEGAELKHDFIETKKPYPGSYKNILNVFMPTKVPVEVIQKYIDERKDITNIHLS